MTQDEDRAPPPTDWPELPDPAMLERIITIIAEEAKVDRALLTPDATLQTIGLESMDTVMILMGLEDAFGAYIPMNEDLSSARNLSELVSAAMRSMQTAAEGGQPAA